MKIIKFKYRSTMIDDNLENCYVTPTDSIQLKSSDYSNDHKVSWLISFTAYEPLWVIQCQILL